MNVENYISAKNFLLASTLLLLVLVYLKSIVHHITLTILSHQPDPSDPEKVEPLHVVIPDMIFPGKGEDFIYQQIAFMGVTGREWFLHFNLIDLLILQNVAAFVMICASQLGCRYYEERYRLGRLVEKKPSGLITWLKEISFSLVAAEWGSDFLENLCSRAQTNFYPTPLPPILKLLNISTLIKWISVILMLIVNLTVLVFAATEHFASLKRLQQQRKGK